MVPVNNLGFGGQFQGARSREFGTRVPPTLTKATSLPVRHPGTYLRLQGAGRSAQGLGTVVHGLGCKVRGLLSRASQPWVKIAGCLSWGLGSRGCKGFGFGC